MKNKKKQTIYPYIIGLLGFIIGIGGAITKDDIKIIIALLALIFATLQMIYEKM